MNVTIPTHEGDMGAYVTHPDGSEAHPVVIVLQEAFGVNSHIQDIADRLSQAGYFAVAPELFHRSGAHLIYGYDELERLRPVFSSLTNDGLTADLEATLAWLLKQPAAEAQRVGVVGFCMGGFVSFLAACRTPVTSAVVFYGGGIATERPGLGLRPLLPEADAIECPVLLFYGGADNNIPQEEVKQVGDTLTALGKRHEVHVLSGAGHGFMCNDRPAHHEEAARAAWDRTLAWFLRTL